MTSIQVISLTTDSRSNAIDYASIILKETTFKIYSLAAYVPVMSREVLMFADSFEQIDRFFNVRQYYSNIFDYFCHVGHQMTDMCGGECCISGNHHQNN